MKNRNNYDRTGSSQDFSNNEGYHNEQDRMDRSNYADSRFTNTPHFSDSQRSNYDDGLSRADGNNYRNDLDRRPERWAAGNSWQRPTSGHADHSSFNSSNQSRPQYRNGSGLNYGAGSSQSDRFDSNYNSDFGYGAGSSASPSSSRPIGTGMGPHAGKGPKGYKRSDERIKEHVSEALRAHSEIDPTEVEIEVKDGVVTLSGTVESRQIKRMIEDEVDAISGVTELKNDIRIMASVEGSGKWKSTASEMSSDNDFQATRNSSSATGKNQAARGSQSTASTTGKSVQ